MKDQHTPSACSRAMPPAFLVTVMLSAFVSLGCEKKTEEAAQSQVSTAPAEQTADAVTEPPKTPLESDEELARLLDVPEPWQYDAEKDKHWDPEHNHWHDGPPPLQLKSGEWDPPDWYYDKANDKHYDPVHGHWHKGPPPADKVEKP